MSALRRIQNELKNINKCDQQNNVFSVSPDANNVYKWKGYIFGPHDSPYQGGIFKIEIDFPPNYPFQPPNIMFKTQIFHPNINKLGVICLDILKNNWTPCLDIHHVLLSISSLLDDPNPNDPLSPEVADVYKKDKKMFDIVAKSWTGRYAQEL